MDEQPGHSAILMLWFDGRFPSQCSLFHFDSLGEKRLVYECVYPHDEKDLKRAIKESIGSGRIYGVVNLEDVVWVGSSSLGFFVRLLQDFHDAGGELILAGLRSRVVGTFKAAGLDSIMAIEPSVDSAVARFLDNR